MSPLGRKKRVLIVQNVVPHYRMDFYLELSKNFDLTILHSGKRVFIGDCRIQELVAPLYKIGPFYFQKGIFFEYSKKYDFIVAMCDLHWFVNFYPLIYRKRTYKFILWGSWLNRNELINFLKIRLARLADANIFYCKYESEKFQRRGIALNKLFVANNTVHVKNRNGYQVNNSRYRILFVGKLDRRKELDKVLLAYHDCLPFIHKSIKLTIIGEGDCKPSLESQVSHMNIMDKVDFIGNLTDLNLLSRYYYESIVSVSYGQAGLSVLQSFAFGVPFITNWNAISGGEKTNILNGYNGFFCDSVLQLSEQLKQLCNDSTLYNELGENAYNYYSEYCTVTEMVRGFESAFGV